VANVFLLFAIVYTVYGETKYRITAQFSGAVQAAFDTTAESDISDWELELKFDDKVKINVRVLVNSNFKLYFRFKSE
jgi:hypothetical protein